MSDLISIVIPCYNDAEFIEQAIDSALAQTYKRKEIVVIDDGSNIKTKEVLKKIKSKIDVLITQNNRGQSKARNVGIQAASGEYILTLDSDDFFEPTFCEKALKIFENNHDVRLITCFSRLIYDKKPSRLYKPLGGGVYNFLFSSSAMGSSFFKKEGWNMIGGYDENMTDGWEDWEFYIRLLKSGGTCEVIPEVLFNYRKRLYSTTSKANTYKLELWRYIMYKHRDLYISDYENLVEFFLKKLEHEELEKVKNRNRIEFIIGETVLKPLRFIKKKIL